MTINPIINNATTRISSASTNRVTYSISNTYNQNASQFSQVLANSNLTYNTGSNTGLVSSGINNKIRSNNLTGGSTELDAYFIEAGLTYNINPNLLKAVAKVESNFRPDAHSSAGAMGVMQIMPSTAEYLGITDPFDARQSIMGGARYLREQLDRFDGDISLALAAYNAGWPAVMKYGGIPPYQETQNYVPKVLEIFGGGDITAGMTSFNEFDSLYRLYNQYSTSMSGNSIQNNGSSASSTDLNAFLIQLMMMFMTSLQMRIGN